MIDEDIGLKENEGLLNPEFNSISHINFNAFKNMDDSKMNKYLREIFILPSLNNLSCFLRNQLIDLYKRGEIKDSNYEFIFTLKTKIIEI